MPDLNPREVIGDNSKSVDYAKLETDRLKSEYVALTETTEELATAFAAIPDVIPDAATKEVVVDFIKRGRDVTKRLDSLHDLEKEPHFRRGQGVDQFFFGLWDRIAKRAKTNRDGMVDVANARLTAYDTRILAEEQERRRLEAEEAQRIATAARLKAEQEAREAEEARLAAERARKPETTVAKTEIAQQAEQSASAAIVEATVADRNAEDAYVATLSRPADIMRTRTESGSMSTMATEPYAEIEKVAELDMAKLWPHVSFAEKEKALRAWAKATNYSEEISGAKVGRRPKSRVR